MTKNDICHSDPHIWSRGKLEPVESCPACGSSEHCGESLLSLDYTSEQSGDRWSFFRCANCRSLYLNPRPDAESLPRAYDSYYTHAFDEKRPTTIGLGGLLWRAIHGYLNRRFGMLRLPAATWGYWLFWMLPPLRLKLDYYGRHLFSERFPKPGYLLDIGCGNGLFLVIAQEMGWTVKGLEPDAKAVAVCRSQGLDVIQGDVTQCPSEWTGAFDVITMSHIIEHVSQPEITLGHVYDLLKPGGILWLALPNIQSLGFIVFKGAWRGLHAPFHLCIPSSGALFEMLTKTGFNHINTYLRGAHAKMICRESANNALLNAQKVHRIKAFLAPVLRYVIDLLGTIFSPLAEEIIFTARRPYK